MEIIVQGIDQIQCFAGPPIKLSAAEVKRLAAAREKAAGDEPVTAADLTIVRTKAAQRDCLAGVPARSPVEERNPCLTASIYRNPGPD